MKLFSKLIHLFTLSLAVFECSYCSSYMPMLVIVIFLIFVSQRGDLNLHFPGYLWDWRTFKILFYTKKSLWIMDFFFLENVRGSPHHSFCVFLIEKNCCPFDHHWGGKTFPSTKPPKFRRGTWELNRQKTIPKSKRFIYTQMELAKEVVSLVKGSS